MSRISKKKLIEILKGEEENTSQLFNKDWVEGLYDEGQWIKGYKRWKKHCNGLFSFSKPKLRQCNRYL